MNQNLYLFGTERPPQKSENFSFGHLTFALEGTGLRHIRYKGAELIRNVSFLVRDRDWGTLSPEITEVSRLIGETLELELSARYQNSEASLLVSIYISINANFISVRARGVSNAPFETNRTGFTILHSAECAGCLLEIEHEDGSFESSVFPSLISPWQPFMGIASLTHYFKGYRIQCDLTGDTFEMEDQRQWGDASFKTYNRPLSLPWPYTIEPQQDIEQSVRIEWQPFETAEVEISDVEDIWVFPEMALVLSATDATRLTREPDYINVVAPQRLLCHIDSTLGGLEYQIKSFALLQKCLPDLVYDIELVCSFNSSVDTELETINSLFISSGLNPDSVMICPSVDRQSTPPGSKWPDCPDLAEIYRVAASVFAGLKRGGGMVSFFPELNRKRPPLQDIQFVSHGLCPIVHAADDVSVMETLDSVPHITRTVRSFIADREYRIGPSTIAMRQNPYGSKTIPNPNLDRICMTDNDPRHRGRFGAAYVVGLAAAIAKGNVSVWTPCAVYGTRGLEGPIIQSLQALAKLAGKPVEFASLQAGLATLRIGGTTLRANLKAKPLMELAEYEVSISTGSPLC